MAIENNLFEVGQTYEF